MYCDKLKCSTNHVEEIMKNRTYYVLKINLDIKIILKIAEILDEKNTSKYSLSATLKEIDCENFNYVSNSSVDVEQSVSNYKNMFSDNSCMFILENLKKKT